MSTTATIPVTADYRELLLAAGVADLVYGLLIHGNHLYALSDGVPCKIIKINKTNLTYTTASFPDDNQHYQIGGFVSAPSTNKLYAIFGSGHPSVITEINPDTLAMTDIINNWAAANEAVIGGRRAFATDNASLFAMFRVDDGLRIAKYSLADLTAEPAVAELDSYAPSGIGLLHHGNHLYAISLTSAPPRLLKINTGTMTLVSATNFPVGTVHSSGDDYLDAMAGEIYVAFEDRAGKVWKFNSAMAVTEIATNISAEHEALQSDGSFIWDLLEDGKAVRISSSGEQRIYALNPGEGFITEIVGDGTYLYASWFQSGSKFTRYNIGPASGSLSWVATVGSSGLDFGNAVVTDSGNNAILTGSINGKVFINKYAPGGGVLWSKQFGSGAGLGVAVDSSGNIFFTGFYNGAANFGGGVIAGAGFSDPFVCKLDSNGNHVWSKGWVGPVEDAATGIAVDLDGNIIITGFFYSSINFGGGALTGAGGSDIFLAKLTGAAGAQIWAKRFGGAEDAQNDVGKCVAVDPSGNIFVGGHFAQSVNFGGGVLTASGLDAFLAKYDTDGNHVWSKKLGGTLADVVNGVATLSDGSAVACGTFMNTADFGSGNVTSSGRRDIFIVRYSSGGTLLWLKTMGGSFQIDEHALGISVDHDDNVLVTGFFSGIMNIGGAVIGSDTTGNDVFALKYRADGTYAWNKTFGGPSTDKGLAITADSDGNVLVAGQFYGHVDFGGQFKQDAGAGDAFLAKYSA